MIGSLNYKRSQHAANIIIPLSVVFGFTILIIITSMISLTILDGYETIFTTWGIPEIMTVIDQFQAVFLIFDKVTVALVIGLIVGIAYTSYRLASRPAYYVITLLFGLFYCFIGYILSYIFSQFASNAALITIIGIFPLTIMVGTNLHWIGLVLIVVGGIALYGKNPDMQEPLR